MKSRLCHLALAALIVGSVSCSKKTGDQPTASATHAGASTALATTHEPSASSDEWTKTTLDDVDPESFWQKFSLAAKAELSKPGADPSDVAALAGELGHDPQKIFEFIRDEIAVEPYVGVLRGPRGTLMTRAGNALDRALLAKELLNASGTDVRLVRGMLSEAQAEGLLARYLAANSIPKVLSELLATPDDASLKAEATSLSTSLGISSSVASEVQQHFREKTQEFWDATNSRRKVQLEILDMQLHAGEVSRKVDGKALSAELKQRLREHYWLQVKERDGTWTPFDPTLPDSKRGAAYGNAPTELTEAPQDRYHRLEFSLVYRTRVNGALKDEVLISGAFRSADAMFEPLEFRIQPADSGIKASSLVALEGKQRMEVLRKVKRFQPLLRAGSKVSGGRAFDLDGNTYDANGPLLGNTGGSFFGDALGGGEEPPAPEFVALQVVLRLTGPGEGVTAQTRTLVRAEDLMTTTFAPPILGWEIFLQPEWVPARFVGFHTLSQTVAAGDALADASNSNALQEFLNQVPPSAPVTLLQMTLLRETVAAEILNERGGLIALVDKPMLTILGHRLTGMADKDGYITAEQYVDIVENGVRYLPKEKSSDSAAFDAALHQSVADCVIEDQLLREVEPESNTSSGAAVFEKAHAEQRHPMLATPYEADKLRNAGVPDADVEWIHDNETPAATLVVATTTSGKSAWWSVRPDGSAILRTQGGRGNAGAEKSILETGLSYAYGAVELGLALHCMYETGAYLFEGYHTNQLPPALATANVALCIAATYTGYGFWAAGLHGASGSLMISEFGWMGMHALLHRTH